MERHRPSLGGGRTILGLLAFSTLVLAAGCGDEDVVRASDRRIREMREVPAFDFVQAHGAMELRITFGERQSVVVEGSDNIVPIIGTSVRDNQLVIEPTKSYTTEGQSLVVEVTVPALAGLDASDAVEATISGLAADTFQLTLNGAGSVRASGQVDRLRIDSNGAGAVHVAHVTARLVEVSANGAATVDVHATESLSGLVAGASTLTYTGTPRVSVSSSGASRVVAR